MSLTMAILIGLAMGVVFGVALEKSRVFEPGVIIGQMRLENFLMLKVFLTAIATGAVVLAALHGLGHVQLYPKPFFPGANVVGGLLLGIGITMAGACPGTVMAQIGAGYRDAWFTLAGGLAGALTYTYFQPAMKEIFQSTGGAKTTLVDLTGQPYWMLALILAAALVLILFALERHRPWQGEIGPNGDGVS